MDLTKKFIYSLEFILLLLSPRWQSWEFTSMAEVILHKRHRQDKELHFHYVMAKGEGKTEIKIRTDRGWVKKKYEEKRKSDKNEDQTKTKKQFLEMKIELPRNDLLEIKQRKICGKESN